MSDEDFPFDRYIKVTEAAILLGYAHYRSINHLIAKGMLQSYALPHVSRKRVLLSDVINLLNKRQSESSHIVKPTKPGRPPKYS
jgi:hypothetical protein